MLFSLIECSPRVAMNVITFLAGRVAFLNQKVATLGGTSVEEKCLAFFKEQYNKYGDCFPFSVSAAARKINAGRASLYRALATLAEKGILLHEESNVQILRPDLLE